MSDEGKQLATQGSEKWLGGQTFSLTPKTLEEAIKFAELIAKSGIVPPCYKDKPGDVLIAVQMGGEVGLKPMQALQGISPINGRPCIWGDALLGVVQGSGLLEYIHESDDGETATCKMKRRGYPDVTVRTFSQADAKQAGLAGKAGPWTNYPKRMRQMRPRGFCARDLFSDVLRGLHVAEEVSDYTEIARVDDATTVVLPKRASEAAPVVTPQAATQDIAPETPKAATLSGQIITRVTKSGDNVYAYVGEARYWTDNADVGAYAKKLKESNTPVEIEAEPEVGGMRKIIELRGAVPAA